MDFHKLAPDIHHTGYLFDAPRAIGIIIPRISIRLGKAFIGFQMFAGVFNPSRFGELIPNGRG